MNKGMKALGITRKFDELGRIVIPKEVRKANSWEDKTPVEIFAVEGGVFIKTYNSTCKLCGQTIEVEKDIELCNSCIEKVKEY